MPKFKTTIEIEVEVTYTIEPAQHGCCDRMGVPEEPSWPAHVSDVDITDLPPQYITDENCKQVEEEAEENFEQLGEE